jgi:type IV secretion system protein VirB2
MDLPVMLTLAIIQSSEAAIPAAVEWAVGTLLGSVATGVAVLAVAFLGFGMLFGHLDWRTGARVVLGIFILFGAPMIARELAGLGRGGEVAAPDPIASESIPAQPEVPAKVANPDPYAGAAIAR